MTNLQILRPEQAAQWMNALEHSMLYDFYHLPQYHALEEERGEGRAHLFVYTEGEYAVALPLLLRPIEELLCHKGSGNGFWDATCVYGYAGPIVSHLSIPTAVLRNFRSSLRQALQELHIVTVFARLHPLIPQHEILADLGECTSGGHTVSIDLTQPLSEQRARYRKNHKRDINRLRRLGATGQHDRARDFLDEFIAIYYETMSRVSATGAYLFEESYLEKLTSALEDQMHLFVCLLEGRVICGGLFALCSGIVQYHLGGTSGEYLDVSPMKLLIDEVRLWANERQANVFHLGGGVGAGQDSLFHFKAGFSDRVHAFGLWRWVLLPEVYHQLCEEKMRWIERCGLASCRAQYFPEYRCPVCPRDEVALYGWCTGKPAHRPG